MRRGVRCFSLVLAVVLTAGLLGGMARGTGTARGLTILFTNDTHDRFTPVAEEGGGTMGGYTRLATALNQARAAATGPVVTLDGGDFSMGSLVQTLYASHAPELRALGAMGYDVATLGNHEFDYRQQGLADMLNAAKASGDPLPALVLANYRTPKDQSAGSALVKAMTDYPVTDYTVVERDGLRIGVFGLMGVDADASAPMSGMAFEPIAAAARLAVARLEEAGVDYIICLSHSGTDSDPKRSEDEVLAKEVPGIDVILSGHTHTTLDAPIQVGNTLIVSSGAYTSSLGVLTVEKPGEAVVLADYRLVPLDDRVPEDVGMTALAKGFEALVGETYLADYGLSYDQVLAETTFPLKHGEDGLGNLIADSYIHAVKAAEGEDYVPVDFSVVAEGVIRGSFQTGEITTAEAFDVSSLGSGGDGTPGYPLISVYVTGRELKDAFEVDASVASLMPAAQLWGAGMTWTYNPNRLLFNRVVSSAQVLENGRTVPLEDDRLYRVVTGLYSGQMLGEVNGKSIGLLTITPKDAQGKPVENFETQIIRDAKGAEVKEWYALASYLQSMGTVDGQYSGPQGRKLSAPSWNPIDLVKNPNWITLTALALVVLVLLVLVLLVRRLTRRGGRPLYRTYRGKRR